MFSGDKICKILDDKLTAYVAEYGKNVILCFLFSLLVKGAGGVRLLIV